MGDFEALASVGVESSVGIPLLYCWVSNCVPLTGSRTMAVGQFDWGGRLLKSNGGVQSLPQYGWKSYIEHKGIR